MSQPHFEGKCEDETCIPKSGNLESSGTLATSEFDSRGQNTSPWSVLYTVEKALKFRCRKWPHMSHSDIYNTSYGRKSNWQFDSRPLKVGNRPDLNVCRWSATSLLQTSSQSEVWAGNYELPKSWESQPGQFLDSFLGVPEIKAIWCREVT